jgi:hypothetical protein
MVWTALGLLALSVALVAILTKAGLWTMDQQRWPSRRYPRLGEWVIEVQAVLGSLHHTPDGFQIDSATMGACRAIFESSGFMVFSRWIVFSIFLSFLLPLWSLSFATEALGGERENNSLIWLLTRPLPRPAIYLAKFLALLPWSIGLNVGGFALLCAVAGPPGATAFRLYWPAVLCATLAFAALFYLMGACFRRPAVVAIVYSFFLEVILGNMPGYLKRVSIGFYTRCMMFEAAQDYGVQPEKPSVFLPVDSATALTVLVGVTIVLLGLGTIIFSRTQYHEVV